MHVCCMCSLHFFLMMYLPEVVLPMTVSTYPIKIKKLHAKERQLHYYQNVHTASTEEHQR